MKKSMWNNIRNSNLQETKTDSGQRSDTNTRK